MTSLLQILLFAVGIVRWIVLVHVIMSWLINFQVLNLRQPLVAQIWYGLNRTLDPIYSRVRRIVPVTGGIDFAPLIVLFAALPGLIAATIFAFTVSWAQFLYPMVFTTSTDQLVLPVGIVTTLIKGDVFNWGQIMTGALLGAAPPLIIYAFLMDYYIAGLTAGATKG